MAIRASTIDPELTVHDADGVESVYWIGPLPGMPAGGGLSIALPEERDIDVEGTKDDHARSTRAAASMARPRSSSGSAPSARAPLAACRRAQHADARTSGGSRTR